MSITVGCLVGSTSSTSINRKLVEGLMAIERAHGPSRADRMDFVDIPIGDLALYDYGCDDAYPAEALALKEAIARCDAVLVATPEYNRSIPGALKNALDWASRPYGENAFTGKPVGIVGASVGAVGTAAAQQHLRTILAYLDAPTLGQPEVFIEFTPERFAEDGTVVDPSTKEFLADWLSAFREWIGHFPRA